MAVSCDGTLGGSRAHSTFFTISAFIIGGNRREAICLGHPFTRVGINVAGTSFRTTRVTNAMVGRSRIGVVKITGALGLLDNTMSNSGGSCAFASTGIPRRGLLISAGTSGAGSRFRCLSVDCVLISGAAMSLRCAFRPRSNGPVILDSKLSGIPMGHG